MRYITLKINKGDIYTTLGAFSIHIMLSLLAGYIGLGIESIGIKDEINQEEQFASDRGLYLNPSSQSPDTVSSGNGSICGCSRTLSCLHLAEAITCELYDGITAITDINEIPISRPEALYRNFIELLSKSPVRERCEMVCRPALHQLKISFKSLQDL